MEMVFEIVVMLMLVGFPVALLLVTIDEYASRSSLLALRHARPASRPKPVHGVHFRWRRNGARTRPRGEVPARNEPGTRQRPVTGRDRIGADAA